MRIFTNKKQGNGHLKIVAISDSIFSQYSLGLDVKIELVGEKTERDQKTLDEVVIPHIIKAVRNMPRPLLEGVLLVKQEAGSNPACDTVS